MLQGSPEDFTRYLQQYSNTICGRHPIGVLLQACFSLHSLLRAGQLGRQFIMSAHICTHTSTSRR